MVALLGAVVMTISNCSPAPDQPLASSDAPIAAMLGAVPASTSLDILTATDFAAARRAAGIEPAQEAEDPSDWLQRFDETARFWPVGFGGSYADQEGWLDAFGFSIGTVIAALEVGVPNNEIKVFAGTDPESIEAAVRRDDAWSRVMTRRRLPSGLLLDWGDGRRNDASNAARTAGEGGQLLLRGELAVRTTASPTMDAVLAGLATGDTLADDVTVMSVINTLFDANLLDANLLDAGRPSAGVYSILLSDRIITSDAGAGDRRRENLALEPYALLGIGLGRDPNGFVGVIVVAHDTPTAAARNFDTFGRILTEGISSITGERWADAITIRSAERRGDQIAFVVEPMVPDGPIQAFLRRDSLFWTTPRY